MIKGIFFFVFLLVFFVGSLDFVFAAFCGGSIRCNCGDLLNSSQTMWYDLTCSFPTPNGLNFWVGGITLDCAGHVISGSGYGAGIASQYGSGRNIIKNCNSNNFTYGIVTYTTSVDILNNNLRNNNYGIHVGSLGNNADVLNNNLMNNEVGIVVDASNTTVLNNILTNNRWGISVNFGSNNNFNSNYVIGSLINGIQLQQQSGNNTRLNNNIICASGSYDIRNNNNFAVGVGNTCGNTFGWNGSTRGCAFMCGNLSGFVTDGHISAGQLHPLKNVKVTLQLPYSNFTGFTNKSGSYSFFSPFDPTGTISPLNANVRIDLKDEQKLISVFDWEGDSSNVTNFRTSSFPINAPRIIKNINAKRPLDLDPAGHNANGIDRLDDLSFIYFHIKEAADLFNENLGFKFNFSMPVEFYGYRPGGGPLFYCPQNMGDCSFNSLITKINSPVARTAFNAGGIPDMHIHEFGHHVMADSLIGGDNAPPPSGPGFVGNHQGINNGLSSDSWDEGFASFVPLITKDIKLNDPNPSFLMTKGAPAGTDMEWNFQVTNGMSGEESAVTGILWDLYDGINNEVGGGVDNDSIQITINQIWNTLNSNGGPGGNRNTLYDVYRAFNGSGIPILLQDADADGINNLDEIFVSHEVYNDLNNNSRYNVGEPVGLTSWNLARPNRHEVPIEEGAYIYLIVVNITNQNITNYTLNIKEINEPSHSSSNREYSLLISSETLVNGSIPFTMPPTDRFTEAFISVYKKGFKPSKAIKINNTYYWDLLSPFENPPPYVLNHTFILF